MSARRLPEGIERYILVRGEPGPGWVSSRDYEYRMGRVADATIFVGGQVVAERCRLGIVEDGDCGRLDWIPIRSAEDARACLHPDVIRGAIEALSD